jgi:CubicO group peptidase (beta-lactamase class C family)
MASGKGLQELLDTMRASHGVVGASLAVLHDGAVTSVASGSLNLLTGVDATEDSLFQVGSITKPFTATLVMQLVEEGRVELDRPVRRYLPGFALADPAVSEQVTVRQLLNHCSGMEGDFFPEDDPFGPSVSGYVTRCRLLPQLHPVGERFSYCNAGYTIAGHLVEVLTGRPWHRVLAERILAPLRMTHAVADTRETLRYRVAMGHLPARHDPASLELAEHCYLPLSLAPAGTVLSTSAADLLAFARMHLDEGVGPDDTRVLTPASVAAMRQPEVELPRHSPPGMTHWGLGWILGEHGSVRVFGHYGGTLGQLAYLRAFPGQGLAIALLTNSPSMAMYEELEAALLSELAGLALPVSTAQDAVPVDADRYCGRYENLSQRVTVGVRDGALVFERQQDGAGASQTGSLLPFDGDCFEEVPDGAGTPQRFHFLGDDPAGRARYLSLGFRLLKRRDGEDAPAALQR